MQVVAASPRITTSLGFTWEAPTQPLSSSKNSSTVRLHPRDPFAAHGVGGSKACGLRTRYSNSFQCHGLGWGGAGGGSNIFERISMIIKSYANAIVSYFEDPAKIIDQAVIEMNNDLVKLCKATAQIMASQKQLEVKYKSAEEAADQWYKRAQLALKNGDERSARLSLKQRKDFTDNQRLIGYQLDQMKGLVENLQSRTRCVQMLESKIHEAQVKKDALKARAVSAQTATRLRNMMNTVSGSGALAAFERMEEKVLMLEFEADTNNQFVINDLEGKFAALEVPTFDEELDELKRKLYRKSKAGSAELPGGRPAIPATSSFSMAEFQMET